MSFPTLHYLISWYHWHSSNMIDFSTNIDITHKSNIGMGLHVWKAVFIEKFPVIPTQLFGCCPYYCKAKYRIYTYLSLLTRVMQRIIVSLANTEVYNPLVSGLLQNITPIILRTYSSHFKFLPWLLSVMSR